ncbi:hypothetical protein QV08_03295 [Gallibacterium salpingitidis]|uniref:Uncharacterized protein n=1 Tax=Gallibacterium salpingitidis TaxID=505341 RepID=A0AB36E248_9PAST|nr:hypothetical protein [Gallibacterium salpingitidis]OBX08839.1 hypothetical protein QV08_03295 [Gallibacterium salpingitidis]OBX10254.1 hypothetical protein QV09_06170 [Gallibacterium salpingitidis]WKT00932.1 hypothetical protein NYR30_06585 [Gallibacterium salpingitidis]
MLESELNRKTRKFTGKIFLLTILLGGVWSLIFNFLFLNGELSKEILIEIQRYSLIIMNVFFSFFYIFFIWSKFGFLNFFVKRLHYDNKIKFLFIYIFIVMFFSVLLYYIIYDIDVSYNTVKSGMTSSERMSNLVFSFTFPGIWYLSHSNLLFTWFITDALILAMLIIRYFFDKNYRERYKRELNNLEKEIENT